MIRIAADRYAQIYEIIHTNDPTAKVFCCGNFYAGYSTWWPPFLHQLELYHPNVRINGIAIHAYPDHSSVGACNDWQGIENLIFSECMKTALTNAYNDLSGMNSPIIDANAPIWITETGVLTSAHILKTQQAIRDYYMRPLINWMQSGAGRYERIGWFISILDQQATTDRTGLFQYVPYNATPSVLSVLGSTWSTAKPATTPTP